MGIVRRLMLASAVVGFCLGAGVRAGEDAPPGGPGGPDGARPGAADGERARGPGQRGDARRGWADAARRGGEGREGARSHGRSGDRMPLLGDVKGMKEELEKHLANMKALQDRLKPPAPPPAPKPGDGPAAPARPDGDGPGPDKEALQARVDQVAPAIVDEYVRHFQAVAELIKADREAAIEKLKEHMMNPRVPGRPAPGAAGAGDPAGPGDAPPRDGEDRKDPPREF